MDAVRPWLLFAATVISTCAHAQSVATDPAATDTTQPPASLIEAITQGDLLLNLRPRWENVAQDNKPDHANALTLRTLLGWRTRPWHGLSLTLEGIDVSHLGDREYATTRTDPHFARYPIVADPDDTDVNQLYLDYTGVPATRVRLGRQSIKLDNVRFVGNVEFRQVMQVFNAVTVENTGLPNTRLIAGYLWRQKNILGDERHLEMPIFNARYTWRPDNDVSGYAYLQDQPVTGQVLNNVPGNSGFDDNSNRILGLRANGSHAFSDRFKLQYTAEYARQDDYAGGDSRIDADYWRIGAGPQLGGWFARVDYEVLSSNRGRYGFQTPIGTNHLFQGWADQFLTTPAQGMRDIYLSAGGKLAGLGMLSGLGIYMEAHRFESDFGNIDFGREFDIGLTYPLWKGLTGKIEYADYRAGDAVPGDSLANKVDVRKFWLTLIYQY
ncbi:MAG: alginate export family protein [Burkholderiales bacterium]|nr:alginate export family protein [Burkholderiales bacterium]